jgi:hypothetical protein
MRQNNHKARHFKKWIFPMMGILVIVLLIFAGNFLNSERPESELSELQTDELPIPEEIKEQGEPEITAKQN